MKDILGVICTIIGAICLIVVLVIVKPFIMFWVAYFGGWIAKQIIGDQLVLAINTLFNTTYFNKDMIPMMAGALGWIGSYFKSESFNNKNNK